MVFALLLLLAASTFEESFRAGLLALQRNDLAAAQTNLTTAAKLAPANGRVWVALAQTFRKLQQGTRADQAAGKAETLGAADPVVLSTLAIYYTESGQLLKAADAEAKYWMLAPNDSPPKLRVGWSLVPWSRGLASSRPRFSRSAMNSISGVMIPWRA